jgi:PAS domain S-box-containing protein
MAIEQERQALARFAVKSKQWHGMLEFRTLAETIPAPMYASDADGGVIYTNSFYQRYSGLSFDELLNDGFLRLFHPDERADLIQQWQGIKQAAEPFETSYRIRRHDGVYRWHVVRGAPVKDAQGEVLRWTGTCTDVDELRSALAKADESRELVAAIGRMTDALMFAKDADGAMVIANDATLQVLGLTEADVIGKRTDQLGGREDDVARIIAADEQVMRTGTIHTVEEHWTGPDGKPRIFRSTKGPWHRADGSIGTVALTVDITRERALEQALADANLRFAKLLEGLPLLLWLTDADGRMIVQNNLWIDYSGLPKSADCPISFADVIDPMQFPDFAEQWTACVRYGDMLDVQVGLFDRLAGRYVGHRVTAVPHRASDGTLTGWVGSALPV